VNDFTSAGRLAELSGKSVDDVKSLLDPLVRKGALTGNSAMINGSFGDATRGTMRALRVLYRNSGLSGVLKVIRDTVRQNVRDIVKYGRRGAGGVTNIPMYALPIYASLLNVHQFYPETSDEDIRASELYREYFIKDGYYKYYEGSEKGTPTWRTIPVNRTIRSDQRILDNEEAHAIIDAATDIALVPCPCRTRTEKLGIRECKDRNPVGACVMMGLSALFFESSGLGQRVSKEKAKEYLDHMQDLGLVAATENYQDINHAVVCLCCECCCSMMRGRTRWDNPDAVLPSNFVPRNNEDCIFCGKCAARCPVEAITVDKKLKKFEVDESRCIGCGVCTITCKKDALRLERVERSESPSNARELYDRIYQENRN